MLGKPGIKGLNEISLEHIFSLIDEEESDFKFEVQASYVEIYNEQIKDLLNFKQNKILHLRDDPNQGLVIANVKTEEVQNISEVKINFCLMILAYEIIEKRKC